MQAAGDSRATSRSESDSIRLSQAACSPSQRSEPYPDRPCEVFDADAARPYWPNTSSLAKKLGLSIETVALSLENLDRLALVYDRPLGNFALTTHPTNENATLDVTNTGRALLTACSR